MNETNPTEKQNSANPVTTGEPGSTGDTPKSASEESPVHEHAPEKEVDLNALFPEAETDLNDLFPDDETRYLLKNIKKNKKDISVIKERLTDENETPDEDEDVSLSEDSSAQPEVDIETK